MAALYNRLQNPDLHQPREERPHRTRTIHKYLYEEFEIPGLPKWGATAVRGNLMDDKEHIRRFIDHVNELPEEKLREAWMACGEAYRRQMEEKRTEIILNPEDSLLSVIGDLIEKRSTGQVQQPLCYAVLSVYHEMIDSDLDVQTKAVYAGDDQSGTKGDVQVEDGDEIVAAYEVKAHKVDGQKVDAVLQDHGDHDYALTIVAKAFDSSIDRHANLCLVRIPDLIETTIGLASSVSGESPERAAERVLKEYNQAMMVYEDSPEYCIDLNS
jgi:hypothetical protein